MHKFIYVIKYFDIQTKPSSSHMCMHVQINISFLSSDISQCNINVVNIIDSRVHRQRRNEYKHITRPKYLWDFLSGYEIDAKGNFLICQIYWLQVACIRYRWLFIIEWFNNVFFPFDQKERSDCWTTVKLSMERWFLMVIFIANWSMSGNGYKSRNFYVFKIYLWTFFHKKIRHRLKHPQPNDF